jgi:(2Fe-2S) ferredoxin
VKYAPEKHVFCCTNLRAEGHPLGCCGSRDAKVLREYMRMQLRQLGITSVQVSASGCLGQCNRGPAVVVYPEGVWYTVETTQQADMLIEQHLVQGQKAEALLMKDPEDDVC